MTGWDPGWGPEPRRLKGAELAAFQALVDRAHQEYRRDWWRQWIPRWWRR